MKTLTILSLIFISFGAIAQHEANSAQSKSYLAVELDPAPFILGGYSFSLKYNPAKLKNWTFMGSVYSSDLPENMISDKNLANGFRNLKIRTSFAAFADYFFKSSKTGLHAGPSVFYYAKSVGSISGSQVSNFKSIYPNLRVGYMYKPFKKIGLYIDPWLNIGKECLIDGEASIEGNEFQLNSISYIIALHIGYQVSF